MKTHQKFIIFQETELSYISGTGKHKNSLIFQDVTFKLKNEILTLKKCRIFHEMEIFDLNIKKFVILQRGTPQKPTKNLL